MCRINIMQRIQKIEIRCRVTKGIIQRSEEGLLRWCGYLERNEENRMTEWKEGLTGVILGRNRGRV